jgi:hypothetical protein
VRTKVRNEQRNANLFPLYLGCVWEGFTKKIRVRSSLSYPNRSSSKSASIFEKKKTTGHLNEIHEAPQVVLHKHRFHKNYKVARKLLTMLPVTQHSASVLS